MRLEVFCEDRRGLTRELLELLTTHHIDLRGIEIDTIGRIYLNFNELDFDIFCQLMAEIRRINGVSDVRTVPYMPSERKHCAVWALLESLSEPVFTVDMKGKVELANQAALTLFGMTKERLGHHNVGTLIGSHEGLRWLENGPHLSHTQKVVIRGQDYLIDINPFYLEEGAEKNAIGSVVMLKSVAHFRQQLRHSIDPDDSGFEQIIAVSSKMRQVWEQARKLAMLDAPLLIIGDTGTGKDMLARACHMRSHRRKEPFLALNCAALPDEVAESELFGHAASFPEKKGFFELANGGTVLLDEIGEMSSHMQTKLLRFLNDGTFRRVGEDREIQVDVRVIGATQKDLAYLVQQGVFREDLYYRLNVLTLHLPPLRERRADIIPLTEMFVSCFAAEQGVPHPKLFMGLGAFLSQYSWPGNVRQLKNAIYRALTQLQGYELRPQDIILPELEAETALEDETLEGSLDDICRRFECSVLTRLYRNYPSTRKLAKRLGVSHTAIANKLREYGLSHHRQTGRYDNKNKQ